MVNDNMSGSAKKMEGSVESAFGTVTGNRFTESKGDAKQVWGAAQDTLEKAEDYVSDSIDSAKTAVTDKPILSILIALGIGFVLGKVVGF